MNIADLRTPRATAVVVIAAILLTVLAAFAIPPGVSAADAADGSRGAFASDLPDAAPEDLSAFVAGGRWGVSFEALMETVAAEELSRRGLNPALRRMGFLGLIEAGDAIAVLLASPEPDAGGIVQLAPGDTLPDGRVLAAVTDNSITLVSSPDGTLPADLDAPGAHREVLLLFPRGEPDPATGRGS